MSVGKVYLVGAGPGDPGLITVRGRELLERADVVVYDSLVNEELLRYAPTAEKIFVGKRPDRHALTQDDINRILVENAATHACVVRLKGGDPFVFGRGGEEALALAEDGIAFEVVPGVTAGVAAPAYAGIPITHRGASAGVAFLTGHFDPAASDAPLSLDRLHLEATLVIYMAVKNLGAIADSLIQLGRAPDTSAVAIEWGTLPNQRTVAATLEDLQKRCAETHIASPVVVVIGDVVSLRDRLSWFEARPLVGRRVVVTVRAKRNAEITRLLHEFGAEVLEFPTVEITPADNQPELDQIENFDWIVFTSRNGVEAVTEGLERRGLDARALHGVRLCAVGRKTSEALAEARLHPDAVCEQYEPELVLGEMESAGDNLAGRKALLPRADVGRSALPKLLRARGVQVTEMTSYVTAPPRCDAERIAALESYRPDYVTFTSAAAVRNFCELLGPERVATIKQIAVFAAIGKTVRRAAKDLGVRVDIMPETPHVADLVDAIVKWELERRSTRSNRKD